MRPYTRVIAMLAMAALTAPIWVYADSPRAQFESGVPLDEIRCQTGMVLLESPRGTPACALTQSVDLLLKLGFASVMPALDRQTESPVFTNNGATVTTDKRSYVRGEPVVITIANAGPETASFSDTSYGFRLLGYKGDVIWASGGGAKIMYIQPGEQVTRIWRPHDLSPGTYMVAANQVTSEPFVILPPLISNVTLGNNNLAIDIYKQISENGENVFFSPAGIYVAFSALLDGAEHATKDQIYQVLGLEPDTDTRQNTVEWFRSSIWGDQYSVPEPASAIWADYKFKPGPWYVSTAKQYYGVHVERIVSERGEAIINDWARDKTINKLDGVVSDEDLTNLSLAVTDVAYVDGYWKTGFPVERTHPDDFWKNDVDLIEVEFMSETGTFYHAFLDGMRMARLPYAGDSVSMLVILPESAEGLEILEDSITNGDMEEWKAAMTLANFTITIPKFEISSSNRLVPALVDLGLTRVFDPDLAELGGVAGDTRGNPHVSEVIQKAFVRVDEEGFNPAPEPETVGSDGLAEFRADRPFMFIIHDDDTGAILSIGRVSDPRS